MNKIAVIIKREYATRVRKKSFIIMTILAPLLMVATIVLPTVFMMNDKGEHKKIAIVEENSDLFKGVIKNTKDVEFVYLNKADINALKDSINKKKYYGVLYIYPEVITIPNAIQLISEKQPSMVLLNHIEASLEKEIERQKLSAYEINNLDEIMKSVHTTVSVQTKKLDKMGAITNTDTGISMVLAYIFGLLMYMLVVIFGSQVMKGVIEEKTSRVVEVIISSVKPMELMLGKIIGIALVGLTQFLILVLSTIVLANVIKFTLLNKPGMEIVQSMPQTIMENNETIPTSAVTQEISSELMEFSKIFDNAMNQPWALIIFAFIFYFIIGYLLYASVFAAIGSAVDTETETQQFMLPVSIPIIIALMVAMGTMQNPESSLAFWCSMIPLTSPIVMMARIPFGVPFWQIGVSMLILVLTFLGFAWMSAKIYRTGILMYGKKTSWKEMWKWLKYSG